MQITKEITAEDIESCVACAFGRKEMRGHWWWEVTPKSH